MNSNSTRRICTIGLFILLLSYLVQGPSLAYATVDCQQTGQWVDKFKSIIANGQKKEYLNFQQEVVLSAGTIAIPCLQLVEEIGAPLPQNQAKLNKNWPNSISRGAESTYEECKQFHCGSNDTIFLLLLDNCYKLGRSQEECSGLKQEFVSHLSLIKKPLSKVRLGVGISLLSAGLLSMILGAIHMGIPLFTLPSGCGSEGFDHPCVADRWGLGGALLGAGLGVAAGGVLTLTLPL